MSRGNRDALAGVLAPQFQIMRANGVRRDLDEYLAGFPALHAVSGDFAIEGMRATGNGDVMVASYNLRIDETIDGSQISRLAPRLTVFRLIDGEWKVVSHANFAVTPEAN